MRLAPSLIMQVIVNYCFSQALTGPGGAAVISLVKKHKILCAEPEDYGGLRRLSSLFDMGIYILTYHKDNNRAGLSIRVFPRLSPNNS
jgi:hypothetical protein